MLRKFFSQRLNRDRQFRWHNDKRNPCIEMCASTSEIFITNFREMVGVTYLSNALQQVKAMSFKPIKSNNQRNG